MPLHKLRKLDDTTAGITLPKGDLRLEGLANEDGELLERPHLNVVRVEEGVWRVERVDELLGEAQPAD